MEIVKNSIKSLEFSEVLEKLASFAKLNQSKLLCINLNPFVQAEEIKQQLKLTAEAKSILDNALDLPLDYVAEIEDIKKSIEKSYLNEQEILDTAKTIRTSRLVKNFLKENTQSDWHMKSLAVNLFANKELEDRIFDIFDNNLSIKKCR